jgi:predicted aconitase with swiveling domain
MRRERDRREDALMPIVLACHRGIGPDVEGPALVAEDNFSARYDLDRLAGTFSRPAHKLHGQSYVGRVLVLETAKGGVASAWMLREMAERGMGPLAILFNDTNTILAQGAAFANLAMVDRFEKGRPTKLIRTGDRLKVEPAEGRVTILDRD